MGSIVPKKQKGCAKTYPLDVAVGWGLCNAALTLSGWHTAGHAAFSIREENISRPFPRLGVRRAHRL